MPDEIVKATKLTISEREYTVDLAGTLDSGKCTIEDGGERIRMRIDGTKGPNAGKTFLAILEFLAPEEIRIAYDLSGSEYPESLEPTPARSNYVAAFKRC